MSKPCSILRRLVARLLPLLLLLGSLASPPARAHELTMAEMQLRETAPGEFWWAWTASEKRAASDDLTPRWPPPCVADGATLRCGAGGLTGPLTIDGVGERYSAVLVRIGWLDGQERVYTLTGGQPEVRLHGSADDRRDGWQIARAYGVLGVEHILSGTDHLLFVIGLLFLVGFGKRLVATITAFTLAHSLTLASAALGWLTLRPPPVEAAIALSIVLVAAEALGVRRGAPTTLAQRFPALVAFLFGLVHGLGFAGALSEIGLPAEHLPVALLTFNLGVEVGQLLTVAAAWGLWLALRRLRAPDAWRALGRSAALYGIGSLAAFWSWGRITAIVA